MIAPTASRGPIRSTAGMLKIARGMAARR